nr:immunoglobulin heavy chain junction region [Macaca mulatta]MOV35812.1 immunoglobulin heavy chain junction region [Macaca mulatta]MOV35832.1 immunoglobulin heavy chain junction region [Macaca mulatta]MOV35884.1 immunoglobulin heavy chain junction region [Macaca mulatta]MOV35905.1 immunoglobulin heavy chain junction region [Macaca mulatta]
CARGYRYW